MSGIVECTEKSGNSAKRVQLEVDFVADRGSQRYYVQSAFAITDEAKREQETRGFYKIPDSFKKVVVVRDNIVPWHDEFGVLYVASNSSCWEIIRWIYKLLNLINRRAIK